MEVTLTDDEINGVMALYVRFATASPWYVRVVMLVYEYDTDAVAADSDEQVRQRVADWERAWGLEPHDWETISDDEGEDIVERQTGMVWPPLTTAEIAHSRRFRKVSNRYPRTVAFAYNGDIATAASDSDEQVAARVADWERAQGWEPRDWHAIGCEERDEGR
jgi:hypothetical protein